MTRGWLVVVCLLAACGSNDTPADRRAKLPGVARVPKVVTAEVLVTDTSKPPPVLVVLDAQGGLHVGVSDSWDALAQNDPLTGAFPTRRDRAAFERLAEGRSLEQPARRIYEMFEPGDPNLIDLESLEEPSEDDPPPPEDEEEEGEEESGGTGTMIALDEGTMGKKESARAKGQYKMKRLDPGREALEAAEAARRDARNELTSAAGTRTAFAEPRSAVSTGLTKSQRIATAEVIKDGTFEPPYCLLLAAPTARATEVVDTVALLHPQIAVAHEGKVRPLRLETIPETDDAHGPRRWIELRVGTTDLAFEAVPDAPILLSGSLEPATFAAALAEARQRRDLPALARVDVLVEPEVDAQRLIDILVALDGAGVVMIGLGRVPAAGSEQASRRGVRRSQVIMGHPSSLGGLSKRDVRRSVKTKIHAIHACYDQALARAPGLRGTVQTQFFITPNGTVTSATASGVDDGLANCVAGAIKALEFPKPAGGGVQQVSYPFTFEE